ncbi:MAG: glycosyltransferase family 2 protein [Pirellulales bacterium]
MELLAKISIVVLAVLAVGQTALVCGFVRKLAGWRQPRLPDEKCPPAVVILCLRGTDPFLSRCIDAILDQDYPRYELRIIVDHPDDPARAVAEASLANRPHAPARLEFLRERRESCSLKCSSVVQAMRGLDPTVEFVAQLDADTIPHRTWLRELAAPFQDGKVGAATGNRWYMPEQPSWGALVRYVWNAAAVVQMYWYRIAWGGTLAVRASILRDSDLLERWGQAFCEDTMLFRVLGQQGMRVEFVPSLMMVNRENCSLTGFVRWMRRQLLTARLYHPRWPAVVAHGIGTSLALAAALVVAAWGALQGQMQTAAWLLGALAIYEGLMIGAVVWIELRMRAIVAARGEPTSWIDGKTGLYWLLAYPVLQFTYPWVLLAAMRFRQVEWRGVTYAVDGPWQIRLTKYEPFAASRESTLTSL